MTAGDPSAEGQVIRLLLADAHRSLVEALAMRLETEPGVLVVGAVWQPEEVLRVAGAQRVDVAVLAVGTAVDFLDAADSLRGVQLVALAEHDDLALVVRVLRRGCRGWVPKQLGVTALLDAVRSVHRGETWIPPLLLTRLLPELLDGQRDDAGVEPRFATLTSRELDVLRAMAHGATRMEIADDLAISANTVRTHMQNVLTKLGVHTSLAAVALARRAGLD